MIDEFIVAKIIKELNLKPNDIYEYYKTGRFFVNPLNFRNFLLSTMKNLVSRVWENESDLYVLNIGREGSGKSLFSIWLSYYLSKEFHKKFDERKIALTHTEWISLQDILEKDFLVHDEAIDTFSALNFQSLESRNALEIAIRNRKAQIINILNIPPLKYVNPYIRDTRMDLIFINMTLDVPTKQDNKRQRVFLKFLLDKDNALKLVDYILKKPTLTKAELIGRFRNKKRWDFVVGGIFYINFEEEDKEFLKLLKRYNLKKDIIKNYVNSKNLLKEVLKNHEFHILENYRGQYSYYLLFLFKIVNKWVELLKNLSLFYLYKEPMKYKILFDINIYPDEKKQKTNTNNMTGFYIPEKLLNTFFMNNVFFHLIKPLIKELKYRWIKSNISEYYKYQDLFYRLDIESILFLGKNNIDNQNVVFEELNYIDKINTFRLYYLINHNKLLSYEELIKLFDDYIQDLTNFFEEFSFLFKFNTDLIPFYLERMSNYPPKNIKEAKENYWNLFISKLKEKNKKVTLINLNNSHLKNMLWYLFSPY